MKLIVTTILLSVTLFGSLLDFKYLNEAKEAYADKNYTKAEALYGKVQLEEATFNQADALYRQGKYQEAIDKYESITDPKLEAKKLHNIGNSYAQLKKLDEAIASYEKSLKIEEDKDTRFNLELLKKKKEEQKKKKKKNDKKNKDNKENKANKDQKKKQNQESKDSKNKNSDKKESKEQKDKKQKEKEEEQRKKESQKKKEAEKKKEQQAKMNDKNTTQPPISNMEERKWQKMLNKRGVKTLMIPLNKGERQHETNPW